MRRHITMLVITVGLIVIAFVATLIGNSRPVLGLDLQGGVSIVLFPVHGSDTSKLSTAAEVIRSRVDGLGIAEPNVSQQGDTIVVDLPGVKDRCRAEALVGETAELRFRLVENLVAYGTSADTNATTTTGPSATTTTIKGAKTTTTAPKKTTTTGHASARRIATQTIAFHRQATGTTTTTAAATPASATGSTTTAPPSTTTTTLAPPKVDCPGEPGSTGATTTSTSSSTTTTTPTKKTTTTGHASVRRIRTQMIAHVGPAGGSSSTTVKGATSTTVKGATTTTPTTAPRKQPTCEGGKLVTPRAQDVADSTVVLPDRKKTACFLLGPTLMTGRGIDSASARIDPNTAKWVVDVTFKTDEFVQKVATPYTNKQVAIVLDGVVQSYPTIQPGITGKNVQITGDFSAKEAKDLALVLRYGSLPIQFDTTQQTVQSVSPSLGKDQLRAGIFAGLLGLILVALYMIFFYRLLGLVVWTGIGLTALTFFSLVTWLSSHQGLTLTLAGVTGLIVSVGVTVDSYVVYFERLKDEVRTGKTVRSSLDSGFRRAFRTIIAADAVSLIAAITLYLFTVGSVRGFAYFLIISTVLDLILAYFFMYPCVSLLSRQPALVRMRGFGVASGLDVPEVRA
ncbi:MAG TPA: protein translocase subunit SecD [Acidimicrobiia bacterium]|nr:protein translocase subunit SecD [Acidimicrobiia bacterium]